MKRFAFILLMSAAPAAAQTPSYIATTMDLARVCASSGAADIDRCSARIAGEVDGIVEGMSRAHVKPWFCLPPASTPLERRLVVRKYMNDHPEALSANVGEMVDAALSAAYPCPHR
jgi:hypothetical protein